jgi:FO synthase
MVMKADPTFMPEEELRKLIAEPCAEHLFARAAAYGTSGALVSYSRKVFIPLTRLCRDVCHYCTFATTPRMLDSPYLSPEQVLAIARAGRDAGCREALFTLGDKPELRWPEARAALDAMGHASTIDYLAQMCELVMAETGLLPHANPGVLTRPEMESLRRVSASQGLMLESTSARLCAKGGPHFGSPDKLPQARLEMIRLAGELSIPFTTGVLIGIGETRAERLDALLALRDLHQRFGHIQEVIIQNFRAKEGTPMSGADSPALEELAWTVALARLVFGPTMNIQAPPNLSPGDYPRLIEAGINDWGGISPVTIDHVNPEMPWPEIEMLRQRTAEAGKILVERLASYPAYCLDAARWHDPQVVPHLLKHCDASGYARCSEWIVGSATPVPVMAAPARRRSADLDAILTRARRGAPLDEGDIVRLFNARADEIGAVCAAADALRQQMCGDTVTYTVNRNINYTNICGFKCQFCAFSKGDTAENLRGTPYDLDAKEVARRASEAWERGATEVCMQGGIHPRYTGNTYLELCRAVKEAVPGMHIHAFSPLEIFQGASTLGLRAEEFLFKLREAGLGTLPGTAAEILDDEVRAILCPDKLNTQEWLDVVEAAHRVGLRTTATIMFGHVDQPKHWARHLLRVRELQERTGGFTEFVPLPFVHMEAPLYRKGRARKGPTFREVILMHAVARLALHPVLTNIQVSWVKLGTDGARACLQAGANDLGGTLMNESISRAAGTEHGQELSPDRMEALIQAMGRVPRQRTTLYGIPPSGQLQRSFTAAPLTPIVLTPPKRKSAHAATIESISTSP